MESLQRNARRKKKGTTPTEPASAAKIPVPLPLDYAKNLVYDNESADERMLVFATDDGLRLMGDAETWFMDGTHSTAPSQFQQVFCIRAPLGETYQSVSYALLTCKTQQTYEELLTAILDVCLQRDVRPNPSRVVVDYEMDIYNALKTTLNYNIDIQGCFYHLTQSTWRRVQADGLQPLYQSDSDIRHFLGMLDGLAFLPVTDVKEGMDVLREVAPASVMSVVDYFDANYVNGSYRTVMSQNGNMKFRRTSPRFEPATWKVHRATIEGRSRTNNVCEGWNHGFGYLVGHKNPSLWTVVKCLSREAAMVEADILRDQRGQCVRKPRRRGVVAHQNTMETLDG